MVRNETSDNKRKPGRQANSEISEIGRRINFALEQLGVDHDVAWLSKTASVPQSTIYDILRRGFGKPDHAIAIARALVVTLDWLLTGAGHGPSGEVFSAEPNPLMLDQLGLRMIPQVDITYSMGGGSVVGDYVESKMVPFRADWLERLTRSGPSDVFLTRGDGDSMMPTILDDDDVLVNRADQAIRQQDRIWALGYGDLGMIKRVRRLPSGLFQLNSDNPAVTPIEATEDELFVVGRVIWIGRRV